MAKGPATPKDFRGFHSRSFAVWALLPVFALLLLGWIGLQRTSLVEEISFIGASSGMVTVASLARPASSGPVSMDPHPVLVIHPRGDIPVGLLPLLDDMARQGTAAMACALPAGDLGGEVEAIKDAVGAFTQRCGFQPADAWIVSFGSTAAETLAYASDFATSGIALLDPLLPDEMATSMRADTPVAILASGDISDRASAQLTLLYESISGEDATLGEPASGGGKTAKLSFLSPDGETSLTRYPGIPTGLGMMTPVFRNDLLRWVGVSFAESENAVTTRLLLPVDIEALFIIGSLTACLVFGSLARLLPKGTEHGRIITRTGLLLAGGLLLVCVAYGLIGRVVWSRMIMRWEAIAAGALILVIRLAVFGFLSLSRGWSGAVDRFIARGLDVVDLAAFLAVAAGVALMDGFDTFSCAAAGIGALCAWGYSRATGGLSGSLVFNHLAGAILLAALV